MKALEPKTTIIWVKKDGKFHGIYIPCVIKTQNGLKIVDWLALSGYQASRKHQLKKHRKKLVSDTLEGCGRLSQWLECEDVYEGSDG